MPETTMPGPAQRQHDPGRMRHGRAPSIRAASSSASGRPAQVGDHHPGGERQRERQVGDEHRPARADDLDAEQGARSTENSTKTGSSMSVPGIDCRPSRPRRNGQPAAELEAHQHVRGRDREERADHRDRAGRSGGC